MLTKEFAQRVELSEKQVRKIVQHLEERGYHLNKTEYRGREATDFQEEDIELFKEIADKVKKTNSYELAFEELEKEHDFLQIVVKEEDETLPSDQNFAKLLSDLHNDITKMREERQMLGQMISQVHQQQKDLQNLQQQMTDKLDRHAETLKAIETAQKEHAKAVSDNTKAVESQTEKILAQPAKEDKTEKEAVKKEEPKKEAVKKETVAPKTQTTPKATTSENKTDNKTTDNKPLSNHTGASVAVDKKENAPKENAPKTTQTTNDKPSVAASQDKKEVPASEVQATPETTTPEPETPVDAPQNQHEPSAPPKKEEKKGFFARLFGM